jgi:hypothetical protein
MKKRLSPVTLAATSICGAENPLETKTCTETRKDSQNHAFDFNSSLLG